MFKSFKEIYSKFNKFQRYVVWCLGVVISFVIIKLFLGSDFEYKYIIDTLIIITLIIEIFFAHKIIEFYKMRETFKKL